MEKGERSRAAMVDACGELLRQVGYRGASMGKMIERSGAPRGSIYHHFPGGKDELVSEALLTSGARWRDHLAAVVEGERELGPMLIAVCRELAAHLEASDFRDGCPIATVALEASADVPAVREACSTHFHENEALIAARLVATGVPAAQAASVATLVLSTLEGALLLAKVYRDGSVLVRAGETLAGLVETALGRSA
ncbi:MAG: TetR/AcrR family transcriptional regulator [Myxococcales bacterium]|nr:TetR/AcrR family transcriptional regulator [Myxococcales bacterium]